MIAQELEVSLHMAFVEARQSCAPAPHRLMICVNR